MDPPPHVRYEDAARLAVGRKLVNLDAIDFAPILAVAKPLLKTAQRLTAWEHDGWLGAAGANMVHRMTEQWTALESAICAVGLADPNTAWLWEDERRKDAAYDLRNLVCDMRKGYLGSETIHVRYVTDDAEAPDQELEKVPAMDTRTPFTYDVLAKRLAVAVEDLEEFQAAPTLNSPNNPTDGKENTRWKFASGESAESADRSHAASKEATEVNKELSEASEGTDTFVRREPSQESVAPMAGASSIVTGSHERERVRRLVVVDEFTPNALGQLGIGTVPGPNLKGRSRVIFDVMHLTSSMQENDFILKVWGHDNVATNTLKTAISRFNGNADAPFNLSREDGRILKIK